MKHVFRIVLVLLALGVAGGVSAGVAFQLLILRDLPDLRSLDDYRPNLITRVRAVDGQVIGEFYKERREVVPIERVPAHVVHAFVDAEDDTFYEHEGLDFASILRAAWANLRAGGIRQGGSTITQQVAKTFLLSSERTYLRKLKDMVLAKRIEDHLDKNEILFLYLNQIYLGSGAYGIQAAAKTYFAKSVDDLTIGEAALIAGLVRAPSRYTPFRNLDTARSRQSYVLRRMYEEGHITEEERLRALEEPLQLSEPGTDRLREMSAFFAEETRRYLVGRFGDTEVLTGGLEVLTTLNVDHQRAAYEAVRNGLRAHDRRLGYRGPLQRVPEEGWPEKIAELTETNGIPPWENGARIRALVVEVDDELEEARLALGEGLETRLRLDDVAWARPRDPKVDGRDRQIDHMRVALKEGYLVLLEKVADSVRLEGGEQSTVELFALYQEPLAEGALLSMDVASGHVQAMVGGYSFSRSQFNRAVQSRRQPGSAFKPIIYATALENGYTPATIVYDTPIVYEDLATGARWKPGNYSDRFYGPITLREALARSRNIATIKILRDVGVRPVIRMAGRLGIRSPLVPDLSLALGSSEVTLPELLRAYSAFPAGGEIVDPIFILEVRNREGEVLERNASLFADELEPEEAPEPTVHEPRSELERVLSQIRETVGGEDSLGPEVEQPLDPVTAYLMTDLLRAVVREGTGWRIKQLKRPVAGKTGTTNDLFDAWFIGFTPRLLAGTWVGYDVPRNLGKNEAGSRAAGPVFLEYMQKALKDQRPREFEVPRDVVYARIDRKSGLLAAPGTEEALFQSFRDGTAPTKISLTGHTTGPQIPPRLD
jgi:penicillin-binding protein 1A